MVRPYLARPAGYDAITYYDKGLKTLPQLFFFFNDTATTEIYTLSLHDALPIFTACRRFDQRFEIPDQGGILGDRRFASRSDRKSTRLNSSHSQISYAVFCLKKKKSPACRASVEDADGVYPRTLLRPRPPSPARS